MTLSPGDVVRDREADDPDKELTVVEVLDERADEHVLFREPGGSEVTVASFHLGKYPADDRVVRAVYGRDVEEHNGSILAAGKTYDFPASRLSAIEEEEERSA